MRNHVLYYWVGLVFFSFFPFGGRFSALNINHIPQIIYLTVVLQLTFLNLRWKMRSSSKVGWTWQVGEFIGSKRAHLHRGSHARSPAQKPGLHTLTEKESESSWDGSTFSACGGCKLSRLTRDSTCSVPGLLLCAATLTLESNINASVLRFLNGKC